ncbi:ABC transporter substrate-binding protein [Roseateles saccharophilus]|uniref:NitT/TauT family transport system substrate-binding protein n=1 Tax=Roseateles saccharophilus TaxID=304 RepID=A0A4V2VSI9_ROSSA|nr:NrtA/SsuA/CpmA family ABC transporter substrate-binding protein [Roseateles saccharophilus]TCV02460.1 NitT/TauT family transport system substrate-binding protein [Roseateles saccharophilus]
MSAKRLAGSGQNRRGLMIGLAAVAALASAYALSRHQKSPALAVERLSIALPLVPHAGLVHIAASKGFFADRGLAVTLLPQSHGKAALAELLRGGADLAASADVPVVIEVLNGAPLSIAATMASASNELAVLARRDRGINAAADLRGHRVGVTLGTSGEFFLWAFLVRHRLAPESLTLVDLPPGRLNAALRDGSVDAIAAWQPVRHEAEATLGHAIASFGAPDAYAQNYVLAGRQDFMSARPEALRRLMLALQDAEHFVQLEPQQAKALLAERLKLDAEALEPAWRTLSLELEQQQSLLVTLEDVAVWAMARGYAPAQPMPNFLPHLYLDALAAVRPERVTVVR